MDGLRQGLGAYNGQIPYNCSRNMLFSLDYNENVHTVYFFRSVCLKIFNKAVMLFGSPGS